MIRRAAVSFLIRAWTWPVSALGHVTIVYVGFLGVLFLLPGAQQSPCVRFPNGVLVTRDAWINFTNPWWRADVAVRAPDGRLLTLGNGFDIRYSDTAVLWSDDALSGRGGYVAYTGEHGFVRGRDRPRLLMRIEDKAGPFRRFGPAGETATNVLGAYRRAADMPDEALRTHDCPVPLVTFARSGRGRFLHGDADLRGAAGAP